MINIINDAGHYLIDHPIHHHRLNNKRSNRGTINMGRVTKRAGRIRNPCSSRNTSSGEKRKGGQGEGSAEISQSTSPAAWRSRDCGWCLRDLWEAYKIHRRRSLELRYRTSWLNLGICTPFCFPLSLERRRKQKHMNDFKLKMNMKRVASGVG